MGPTYSKIGAASGSINQLTSSLNDRMNKGDLSLVAALLAKSDGIDNLTPMLATAGNFAKCLAAATTVLGATATLCGHQAMSHFKKIGQEMSESLKKLCELAAVSANLNHQERFPQWVYDFASDQIAVVAYNQELELINNENLERRSRMLNNPGLSFEKAKKEKVANYFFVYHPATDWHAPFNMMIRKTPLPGFVGCTNSIEGLGLYLSEFRKLVGPEAVLHVLLPSAHMYVIEENISIPQELQPMKIVGQRHYSGNPYVHASVEGLREHEIRDVGLVVKPNVIGAWTKVGAAAGGIGAGIAGVWGLS
jgi:hypothetical protein